MPPKSFTVSLQSLLLFPLLCKAATTKVIANMLLNAIAIF